MSEIWRVERAPAGFVAIRSDESPLIATVHDEWCGQLIARAPMMEDAILQTINVARRDETIDPLDTCYIITEYQMNMLMDSVGMTPLSLMCCSSRLVKKRIWRDSLMEHAGRP
jgi:hypothetical protein